MKNDDKILFTEDVFDELQKKGYDRELVENFFKHFVTYLRESIRKTDNVAYFIRELGTFYLTLTGANYSLKELERKTPIDDEKKKMIEKTIEGIQMKKQRIQKNIKALKNNGNYAISYFDRIFNPKGIKNT